MTRPNALRRPWRMLCAAAFVGLVVVWAIFLRPQFLGGPAAYVMISGSSMEPAMRTGDVVMVHRQATYRTGDVVAYPDTPGRGRSGPGRDPSHRRRLTGRGVRHARR